MKTKRLFQWLPAAAAVLLATACSSDNDLTTMDNGDKQVKVIHYEATVSDGDATRATLNGDKQYIFEAGDKLYVEGTDISGVLTLKDGDEGKRSGATFSGDLTYTGDAEAPDGSLTLTAVLVSSSDAIHTITDGKVTATAYPTTAIASTLAEAVQKYSHFTATSNYADKSFSLSQQSAFLNFTVTFEDGTVENTSVSVSIKNGGSEVRTGSVTTATVESKVVAQFVAAFPGGETTMDNASVVLGSRDAISFGGTTTLTANKIYNIKKPTATARPVAEATTDDIGKVIGVNGRIYDDKDAAVAAGTTASAIIAYVGSDTRESGFTHGLAIAMKDANSGNRCQWKTSGGTEDNGTGHQYTTADAALAANESGSVLSSGRNDDTWPAFKAALNNSITVESGISADAPSGTSGWFLPTIYQWNQMVNGLTGTTTPLTTAFNDVLDYNAVNPKITAAGGSALPFYRFWSSTEYDSNYAWYYGGSGDAVKDGKTNGSYVRAVFAF